MSSYVFRKILSMTPAGLVPFSRDPHFGRVGALARTESRERGMPADASGVTTGLFLVDGARLVDQDQAGELHPARDVELGEGVAQVAVDGVRGEKHAGRDFVVR